MIRLFEDRTKRHVKSLNGAWKMRIDPEKVGVTNEWYRANIDGETVMVPSVFATDKKLFAYEGAAWYERSFYFEGGCLFLSFGAVMTEAQVWLDGEYLGEHYGGFCQFDFTVDNVSEGTHRLTVRVDNSFDADSIPQPFVDWYHHGGIVREVEAHTLRGIAVVSNKFDYTLSDNLTTADCRFTVTLYNTSEDKTESGLTLTVDGATVYEGKVALEGRETKVVEVSDVKIENVRLWDIGRGELYTVTAATDTDDLIDRIGLRRFEVKDKKLLLNNRAVELMGVNRHEEHPEHGFAFPHDLMARDVALIEEMNCNFIRGSHYTNSQSFVDMLDEHGIMFWSEIPIWGCGFSKETLGREKVVARGLDMHREMLKYYYNHPSIVMWGMHNEIWSDSPEGYEMSKLYYNYLKENGGNRLVVYACHLPMTDISLEFTDVICLNLYYGWYHSEFETWHVALDKFTARQKELGLEDKPIVMSEFGAAALYGCHDDDSFHWTEEYQARLIKFCLECFHARPGIVGELIWHFADARTSKQAGISRARRFNNKGLINEYRKPKLAYFEAQRCFERFAKENAEQ